MAETQSVNMTLLNTAGKMVQQCVQGAPVRHVCDTIEVPGALALNDTVRFMRLPADAVVADIKFGCDDLGSVGTIDIGIAYPPTVQAGAVIAATAFKSAIDVHTAAVAMTSYRFAAKGIETINQKLWELAGLSAKPACAELDIVLTASAATDAAGTISMSAAYAHI